MAYPDYEERTLTHGISHGAFAKITVDEEGKLDTTVKPTPWTGLRGANVETEQESTPFYADNVEHARVSGAKNVTGTITCYQYPQEFMIEHMGMKLIEKTGAIIDTGTKSNFIFQYVDTITTGRGDTIEQLNIYYNCSVGDPTRETTTDEDTATPIEFEFPLTISPQPLVKDDEGKAVTYLQLLKNEKNAALFDLAYEQILLPDTLPPEIKKTLTVDMKVNDA